jgi:hypothetical protein
MPVTGDDAWLEAVRAAAARISATLLELRELVGGLRWERRAWTGASALAVQEVRDRLHRYGCLYLALDNLLERAVELAENGGEPARLLDGACEVVFTAGTGDPVETVRLSIADLVAAADREAAALCGVVGAQRAAERSVREDLARIAIRLDELRLRADAIGAAEHVLAPLAFDLAELERTASADPRTADGPGPWRDGLARLETGLAEATAAVTSVEDLRARLVVLADRLETAVRRLRRRADEAAAAGLGSGVDPAEWAVPAKLSDRLAAATADGSAGDWWQKVDGPEGGLAMVTEVQDRVERIDTARRRLRADCRSELRGRLEGYRQKAVDDGRGEDTALDARYQAARESLGILAFDVPAAAEAVRAYQRAVNGEPA